MALTSNQRNWSVFSGAIAVTVMAAAIYPGNAGVKDDTIRLTAFFAKRRPRAQRQ